MSNSDAEAIRPASRYRALTPSDSAQVTQVNGRGPSMLYIGTVGDGTLTLIGDDGVSCAWVGLTAGSTIEGGCQKIMATGTGVSDIVGYYN